MTTENVIAEAVAQSTEPEAIPQSDETVTEDQGAAQEGEPTDAKKPDNDPVKLAKALERQKSRYAKKEAVYQEERRRSAQLERELNELRSGASQQRPNAKLEPPSPENFTTWADFNKAQQEYFEHVADLKAGAKIKEFKEESRREQETSSTQQRQAQLVSEFEAKEFELREKFPDLEQVTAEYADEFIALPQHVKSMILELQDPLLPYLAAKEGLLEKLGEMSPATAAVQIARLQLKAESLVQAKPVSRTPQPMTPTKGSSSGKRSLDQLSPKELIKWAESRDQ